MGIATKELRFDWRRARVSEFDEEVEETGFSFGNDSTPIAPQSIPEAVMEMDNFDIDDI